MSGTLSAAMSCLSANPDPFAMTWLAIAAADPTCVHAAAEVAADATLEALRDRSLPSDRVAVLIRQALACTVAFHESRWRGLGTAYMRRVRAFLHLMMALLLDHLDERHAAAAEHYMLATDLGEPERRVFMLRAACVARDATLPDAKLAAAVVHAEAVARGLWARVEQRPLQLVPSLVADATPWLDAHAYPVCAALTANYARIREEALSLLARDGARHADTTEPVFKRVRADASVRGLPVLTGGGLDAAGSAKAAANWLDVSLVANGKRHERGAALAPFTSGLLLSDSGGMLRDAASCVLGSAFFSLLAPGTRLRRHCGPTNARLRCHLPLLVPPGDCAMRVGRTSMRRRFQVVK